MPKGNMSVIIIHVNNKVAIIMGGTASGITSVYNDRGILVF